MLVPEGGEVPSANVYHEARSQGKYIASCSLYPSTPGKHHIYVCTLIAPMVKRAPPVTAHATAKSTNADASGISHGTMTYLRAHETTFMGTNVFRV